VTISSPGTFPSKLTSMSSPTKNRSRSLRNCRPNAKQREVAEAKRAAEAAYAAEPPGREARKAEARLRPNKKPANNAGRRTGNRAQVCVGQLFPPGSLLQV